MPQLRPDAAKEVNTYFASDKARQCKPTDYAVANKVWVAGNGNCCWWLRSPGGYGNGAARVNNDGGVHEGGFGVDYDINAVRPAMWIDLDD